MSNSEENNTENQQPRQASETQQAPDKYRKKVSNLAKVMFGFTAFSAIIGGASGLTTIITGIPWYIPVAISLAITAVVVPLYAVFATRSSEEETMEKKIKYEHKEKKRKETADMVSNINRLSNKMNNMVQNVAILSTNTNDTANDIQKIASETNRTTQQMNNVSNNMNNVLNHMNTMTQQVNQSVTQTQSIVEDLKEIQENNKQLKNELTNISHDNQILKQQLNQSIGNEERRRQQVEGLRKLIEEITNKDRRKILAEGLTELANKDQLQNLFNTISHNPVNNINPMNTTNKINTFLARTGIFTNSN